MNVKAEIFNGDNISFVDYKHFNRNKHTLDKQIGTNVFNLLPVDSTNDSYFEAHMEHNDQGLYYE
jgi:hypothetical protein